MNKNLNVYDQGEFLNKRSKRISNRMKYYYQRVHLKTQCITHMQSKKRKKIQ